MLQDRTSPGASSPCVPPAPRERVSLPFYQSLTTLQGSRARREPGCLSPYLTPRTSCYTKPRHAHRPQQEPSLPSPLIADAEWQEWHSLALGLVSKEPVLSTFPRHRNSCFPIPFPCLQDSVPASLSACAGPRESSSASPGGCPPLSHRSPPHTKTSKYSFHHR